MVGLHGVLVFRFGVPVFRCLLMSFRKPDRLFRSVLSVQFFKFNNATEKKLKPLEGQTKLSFAEPNEESQQVQEAVTAIDNMRATANEGKAQG